MKRKVQMKDLTSPNQYIVEKNTVFEEESTALTDQHCIVCNAKPTNNTDHEDDPLLEESLSIFGDQVKNSCFSFVVSPTISDINHTNDEIPPKYYASGESRHVSIPFYSLQEREVLINEESHSRVVLESSDGSSAYDLDIGVPIKVYSAKPRGNCVSLQQQQSITMTSCSSNQENSMDYIFEWSFGKIYMIRKSHIIFSYTPNKSIKVEKQHSITINNQLYYIYDPVETSDNVFAISTCFHSVSLLEKRKVLYINQTTPHELILELVEDILEIELMNPLHNNNNNSNDRITTSTSTCVQRRKCYLQLEKDYHLKLIRYGDKLFTNLMYGQVRSSYLLKKVPIMNTTNTTTTTITSTSTINDIEAKENNNVKQATRYYLDFSSQRIALKIFRYNHRESAIRINHLHENLYFHKYILTNQLNILLPSIQNRNENIIKEIEFMNYLTNYCNSETIVPLKDTAISVDHIYTVTNLYPIGSLKKYLDKFHKKDCCGGGGSSIRLDERVVRVIILDILHSLASLHSHGIAHQDISIENILLHTKTSDMSVLSSENQIPPENNDKHSDDVRGFHLLYGGYRFLLIDMGHARAHEYDPNIDTSQRMIPSYKQQQHSQQHAQFQRGAFKLLKNSAGQQLGKLYYHCPDLPIAPQECHYYCGFAVDCWQMGVLMFILLTGQTPFETSSSSSSHNHHKYSSIKRDYSNRQQWFDLIRNNQLSSKRILLKETNKFVTLKDIISTSCLDLLEQLLTFDPANRITIEKALNHQWLQDKE